MQCHFLLQLVGKLPENIENFLGEEPGIKSTRYTKWALTLSPGDAIIQLVALVITLEINIPCSGDNTGN